MKNRMILRSYIPNPILASYFYVIDLDNFDNQEIHNFDGSITSSKYKISKDGLLKDLANRYLVLSSEDEYKKTIQPKYVWQWMLKCNRTGDYLITKGYYEIANDALYDPICGNSRTFQVIGKVEESKKQLLRR